MSRDTIPFRWTDWNGNDLHRELPAKWKLCASCDGCGTDRGANVECDGGGFTSSEWAEQDDDFREDYLAGRYDRPCPTCSGQRVILVPDRRNIPTAILALYDTAQAEERSYRQMCDMERRMGA